MEDAAPPAAAGPQLQQPASACSLDQPRSETNDTLSLLAKSFSLCPDAFGLTRLADGLIVAVNDGFSRVTGYTQAEVVGRPAARLGIWANPQDRERLLALLREQPRLCDFAFPFRIKGGELRDGLLSAQIMEIAGEQFVLALWRDMTEEKRAAEERERLVRRLEAEGAFLQEVLRQMQKGVIIAEAPSGRLLMGNAQVGRIWGRPLEPARVFDNRVPYRGFHPNGRPYEPGEWPLDRAMTKGEVITDEEIEFERADGGRGFMSVSAAPVRDTGGRIVAGVETFHDISDLKAAAHELVQRAATLQQQAELLDLAHDAIISLKLDGTITFWNRGAEATYGWTAEEAHGRNVRNLLQTRFPLPRSEIEAELMQSGRWEGELVHRRRDGSRVVVASRWSLQRDEQGRSLQILQINNNITRRKQAEATLERYTRRLQALHELDQAILATRSPEEIAPTALQHIRQLVSCAGAEVAIFDFDANEALVLAVECDLPDSPARGARIPLSSIPLPESYRQGKSHLRVEAGDAGRIVTAFSAPHLAQLSSCISVPLVSVGQLIGSLNIWIKEAAVPDTLYLEIAREVANELAIAIQKSRLFEQVEEARGRLQHLSRRLLETQEQERRLIARELHDQVGQVLTAVQINIEALQRLPEAARLAELMGESVHLVEQALEQVRTLSLDLRPSLLDDLGLPVALKWYAGRLGGRAGLEVAVSAEGVAGRLPEVIETTSFRIVQEALTNVLRHARARRVEVALQQQAGQVELIVRDDGVGFDPARARTDARRGASLGLLGMQERAELAGGSLVVESTPGRGTIVRAAFSLPE